MANNIGCGWKLSRVVRQLTRPLRVLHVQLCGALCAPDSRWQGAYGLVWTTALECGCRQQSAAISSLIMLTAGASAHRPTPRLRTCHWRTFKLNLPIKIFQKGMTKKHTNTKHVPCTPTELCLMCFTMRKTSIIYALKGALLYHFKIVTVTSPVGVSS